MWTLYNGSLNSSKLLYCLKITKKYSVQHWLQSEKWLNITIIQSLWANSLYKWILISTQFKVAPPNLFFFPNSDFFPIFYRKLNTVESLAVSLSRHMHTMHIIHIHTQHAQLFSLWEAVWLRASSHYHWYLYTLSTPRSFLCHMHSLNTIISSQPSLPRVRSHTHADARTHTTAALHSHAALRLAARLVTCWLHMLRACCLCLRSCSFVAEHQPTWAQWQ